MFGDGLLVFNTCQALDWMLIKNAKLVDKSNYLSRILKNFGGSTYVFAKNSSEQAKTKKFVAEFYNGENLKHLEKLLRKHVQEKLNALQNRAKNGKLWLQFNITNEVVDTIGEFILRAAFGESDVSLDEKVGIFIDGTEQDLSFPVGLRTVWNQAFMAKGSFYRIFLLDPLADWCLTTEERNIRHNQNVIKQFVRDKLAKHSQWRK